MRDHLLGLNKANILDLFGRLNGTGKPGFDHERVKKTQCVDLLLGGTITLDDRTIGPWGWSESEIQAALAEINAAAPDGAPARAFAAAPAAPAVDQTAIAQQIGALFASLAGSAVNESKVREIVTSEVKTALEQSPVVRIEVARPDGTTHKVEGHARAEFQRILRRAIAGKNQLLVGPAGCGKTHLAHQVAEALGRPFASVSCTAGMSESTLSGWLLPAEGGEFQYVESDFVRLYEGGGVFLFDEVDAADPNTLLFINQALANGSFYLPQRKGCSQVKRHAEFVCIAAANTYGTGANMVYAGRERLDESTLDRFRAGLTVLDYDTEFERKAVEPELLAWGWAVRARIRESRLSRVLSTRFLLDATDLMRVGETFEEIKETFFTGWKADEKSKAEV